MKLCSTSTDKDVTGETIKISTLNSNPLINQSTQYHDHQTSITLLTITLVEQHVAHNNQQPKI